MLRQQERKKFSFALIFVLLITMLMPNLAIGAAAAPLTDISSSYAQNEIQSLAERGIISGYEDGTFQPTKAMSRAELAKIISLSLDLKEKPELAEKFKDVAPSSWYRGYVGAITEYGITQGTAVDKFSPDASVTREELVVFFVRSLGLEEAAGKLPLDAELADLADISDWAQPAVSLAYKIGFVKGVGQAGAVKFFPKELAERQALARLAYEFITNKSKLTDQTQALLGADAAPTVNLVTVINNTTVEVSFDKGVNTVNLSDFAFNGLNITKAELKSGNNKVAVLTTDAQAMGTVYTLRYQGKDTGKTFTGTGPVFVGGGGSGYVPGGSASDTDKLNAGGTYASLTITASGTFGPTAGTTVITDTLTLDPGAAGEITLQNVEAEHIVVVSGSENSIKLKNTIINTLKVAAANQANAARIESLEGSQVTTTLIQSKVIIESTAGNLGMIKIGYGAAGQKVELRGTLQGDISVDSSSTQIDIAPPTGGGTTSVANLNVSSQASIVVAPGASLENVNITSANAAINLSGEGNVDNITVSKEAAGATLNLATTHIASLKLEANVKLEGDAATIGSVPITAAPDVTVEVPTTILDALKTNAGAAIADIGEFTAYSAVLDAKIQKAETIANNAVVLGANPADIPGYSTILPAAKAEITTYGLQAAYAQLEIIFAKGDNHEAVTGDVTLQAADSARGVKITWNSSNSAWIGLDGKVTRPAAGEPDSHVVLTATLTKNGGQLTKEFSLTVLPQVAGPELVSLSIEPASLQLQIGQTQQLSVIGHYSDQSTKSLTNEAAYTSTRPAVATVSPLGAVAAISKGTTEIETAHNGKSARLLVTVTSPIELKLEVTSGEHQATLHWNSIGSSVTYLVYQSNTSGAFTNSPLTVQGVTYTMNGLTEGLDYYFIVKTWVGDAEITSNEDHAIPLGTGQPLPPTSLPTVTGTVYTNGWVLSGMSEPYANYQYTSISLSKRNGSSLSTLYTVTAEPSGAFTMLSRYQDVNLTAGEEILLTSQAYGKSKSEPVVLTVVPINGQTAAPTVTGTVNEVSNITGTAEPGAVVYLKRQSAVSQPGSTNGSNNGSTDSNSGQSSPGTKITATIASSTGEFTFYGYEGQFSVGQELTITAMSLGKAVSEPIYITVVSAPQTETPTVTGTVYTNSWRIHGSGEPSVPSANEYSYVNLTKEDGRYIAGAGVASDGQFTIESMKYDSNLSLTDGETVLLTVQAYGKKKSTPVPLIVKATSVKTARVMVDIANEVIISGWAEYSSFVTVKGSSDSSTLTTTASATTGAFTVTLTEGTYRADDQLSITSAVIGQETSEAVQVILKAAPVTAKPTVTGSVYTNMLDLNGTMEAGSANAYTNVHLTKQNGNWVYGLSSIWGSYYIDQLLEPSAYLTEGEELLLTAKAFGKKRSEPVRVIVQGVNGQTAIPTQIEINQALIKGKAELGAIIMISLSSTGGGKRTITLTASSVNGNFSYSSPSSPLPEGALVSITATAIGKATSEPVEARVGASQKTPAPKVTSGSVYTNSFILSGTTDPADQNITVYITSTAGNYIGSIGVYNGSFSGSDLINDSLVAGQEVLVTAEAYGKTKSDPVRITVKATEGQTAVPSYSELSSSNYLTGKAEPGAFVRLANDTLGYSRTDTADANGQYSIFVDPVNDLKVGTQLTLTATVIGKATSDTTHITIVEE